VNLLQNCPIRPFSSPFFPLPLLVGCPPSPVHPPIAQYHLPPFYIIIGETLPCIRSFHSLLVYPFKLG
ncbi:unnamed protein product, partial [Penicillium nalgiovense]